MGGELDVEGGHIQKAVSLEGSDKEDPVLVENLCEEIPENPHVGSQIK